MLTLKINIITITVIILHCRHLDVSVYGKNEKYKNELSDIYDNYCLNYINNIINIIIFNNDINITKYNDDKISISYNHEYKFECPSPISYLQQSSQSSQTTTATITMTMMTTTSITDCICCFSHSKYC